MSDYENAVSLPELHKAMMQCARGVRYKDSVMNFVNDGICKCHKLSQDIVTDKYKISRYLYFTITEPKRRDIVATRFRDRVWQKSMCNNGIREQLLKPLIYDNGACQKHRGVDFAIDRIICFLQKYYRKNGTNKGWYSHLDIKSYFPSTPHSVSKDIVSQYVKDDTFKEHLYTIIDSFKDARSQAEIDADRFGERGTALGSEISQLLQLMVLNKIDHAVKEKFRIKYHCRFNDDMLLISSDKEELKAVEKFITDECAKLGLIVVAKTRCGKIEQNIKFLKRKFILTEHGKVVVKAMHDKFGKERRRLRKMKCKNIGIERVERHYLSVRGILSRCDNDKQIKSLDSYYLSLFGNLPIIKRRKRGTKNAYSQDKRTNRNRRAQDSRTESR